MQPNAARRLAQSALETWTHVSARVAEGEPADVALQAWWRTHRQYGSRDRRFISESIFSSFRWKGWLDDARLSPSVTLALAYLLDAAEPHMSATALLQEASGVDEPTPAGSLDCTAKGQWLARVLGWPEPPPLTRLVPEWVAQTMSAPDLQRFVRSSQQRPPLWLRCKSGDAAAVVRTLCDQGFPALPHPSIPDAVSVSKTPPQNVIRDLERRGCTPQDISSQCVGWLCQAQSGQRWWDMCAGAGGKTLHLADQLAGRGSVLATDIRESALQELDRRARAMRVSGLNLRLLRPDADPPGAPFDGILVDAPCSGLGTWGRNPDARWRTTLEAVERSAATQLSLLDRASRHVSPGGCIVFATCSVTQQEGAGVLNAFLASHPGWEYQSPARPLLNSRSTFPLTVWPDQGPGIGMCMARLKKIQ